MEQSLRQKMGQRALDLLVVAGIFVAYSVTTRLALGLDFVGCLLGGAANTVPPVILGIAIRRIIVRKLIGKPVMIQLAAHLLLCMVFILLSYGMLIVLLGVVNWAGPDGFVVKPFGASGAAWQSLENATTYALIVAVSYLQALNNTSIDRFPEASETAPVAAQLPASVAPNALMSEERVVSSTHHTPQGSLETESETRVDAGLSRYFVKIGDELRPLDIDTVVSIGGADDYAEVRTTGGKHLVRVTLAEFTKSLDPAKFVRVHRSWIVNTHRIGRAESAGGGRLLLHMETGQTISTSRDGAKLLRDRVL